MRLGDQAAPLELSLDLHTDWMVGSVDLQDSLKHRLKLIFLQTAGHAPRFKNNFRILLGFKHLLLHSPIARADAAVAAFRIDNYNAAGFAGGRIRADRPAFEFEIPVRGMERAGQTK